MKTIEIKPLFIAISISLLVSFPALSGTTQYTYDDLNRLVRVTYKNGITLEYTYDEAGNRLSKDIITDFLAGDIDHSSTVDLQDAILALKLSAGITPSDIWPGGDTNNDKKIGIEDAIYILQKVAKLR